MHVHDLVKLVAAGDACVDAQQALLERLERTGTLDMDAATGLRARLDQITADLRQAHHHVAAMMKRAPTGPVQRLKD